MGICASDSSSSTGMTSQQKQQALQEKQINRSLDRQQRQDGQQEKETKKLLLLGAGESGKSTLFKQMITIYGKGFPDAERKNFTVVIYINVISSMQTLVDNAVAHGGGVAIACTTAAEAVKVKGYEVLNSDNVGYFKDLWADKAIQNAYSNRSKFQLPDSAKYFFERLDVIATEGYLPSQQDVLRSRVRTTGICENEFIIEGNTFKMYDVGGQRTERKKWIHCFENVTAVIFVGVLSEYDLMLYEDDKTNRMMETVTLFDEICNSRWFQRTSIILFLNKRDLFEEKILTVPLTVCPLFAEYRGPNTYEAGCQLIEDTFLTRNQNPDAQQIYTHITCATDTNNIAVVFEAVKDIIIRRSLGEVGLI